MNDQQLLEVFLGKMMNYFRFCEAEYVPHAKKIIVRILDDVYTYDKPPVMAMEDILAYLAKAFPKQQPLLKEMDDICQEALVEQEELTS